MVHKGTGARSGIKKECVGALVAIKQEPGSEESQQISERKRKQREYEGKRPRRTRACQKQVDSIAEKLRETSLVAIQACDV